MGARNPDPEIYAEFVEKMTKINRERSRKKHTWWSRRVKPGKVVEDKDDEQ